MRTSGSYVKVFDDGIIIIADLVVVISVRVAVLDFSYFNVAFELLQQANHLAF